MAQPATATLEHRKVAATSAPPPRRVFVIDDDPVMLLSCRRILEKDGYEVETCSGGVEGIRRIEEVRPELLLVDLKMPELDGMQVIERVRAVDPEIVIAVITGYATIATAIDAMQAGAYDFLPKPFTPDELRLIVNRGHERWRLGAESARLRHEKEEAERRFVTFVSHQLQSPLSVVHQYLDVMKRLGSAEAESKRAEWLDRCLERTSQLQALIRDWLTLSRIESGSMARSDEPVDVRDIVPEVVAGCEPMATAANVRLISETGARACPVLADRTALHVLIENLVVNGIKYNRPKGTVTVSLKIHGNEIELSVADTGIGISEKHLEFLFHEFFRAHSEAGDDVPGTGLGLAICKRIAAELGGTIEVSSAEGSGTTFRVLLPLVTQSAQEAIPAGAV